MYMPFKQPLLIVNDETGLTTTSPTRSIIAGGESNIQRQFAVNFELTQVHAGTVDAHVDAQVGADFEQYLSQTQQNAPGTQSETLVSSGGLSTAVRAVVVGGGGGTYRGTVWLMSNLPFSLLPAI